jgi:membrane dipeptidase
MREALVIDAHNDTIVMHVWCDGLSIVDSLTPREGLRNGVMALLKRCGSPLLLQQPQLDVQRMQAAGIDVGFFAIDVSPAHGQRLAYALDGFGALMADVEQSGALVSWIRCAADVVAAKASGRPGVLLAIEHAGATEGSLNVLRALYALGVRSIGLTHNIGSVAADGVADARDGVGLTRFGVSLIREMNRLGMLVDLAHISERGFFHALEVSERPVMFSHGNARALCDHVRNLSDEQLRALRANGGVIGLSLVPMFVDEARPSLGRLLDHVDHIVRVAGIETVGLGSDFDGGGTLLHDAGGLYTITEGLLARGYQEGDVRLILGENTLRVLEAALG